MLLIFEAYSIIFRDYLTFSPFFIFSKKVVIFLAYAMRESMKYDFSCPHTKAYNVILAVLLNSLF